MKKINNLILIFLLLFHAVLGWKLKFTAWPEMLTYPWLMNSGYRLYTDIIMPYFPMLPVLLNNIYRISGFSVFTLKIITLFVMILTDFEIYWISRKIYNKQFALISVFGFIFSQLYFDGNGLWFDLVSVPLVLLMLYLMTDDKFKHLAVSGFILGILILIKQTNVIFTIPVLIRIYKRKIYIFRFVLFSLMPFAIVFSYYLMTPDFKEFFYWSIYHPLFVHSRIPGFILMPSSKQILLVTFWFSPLLFIRKRIYFISWLACSFVFAVPRFALFHFQIAVAIFWVIIPSVLTSKNRLIRTYLVLYLIFISILFSKFLIRDWNKPERFFTDDVNQVKLAAEQVIPDNEEVFYFNASSEYFVLGHIYPSKPWADNFPWYMEIPGVQEKVISGLNNIKYIIYNPFQNKGPYELGSYRPEQIYNYINANFIYQENLNSSIQLLIRKT